MAASNLAAGRASRLTRARVRAAWAFVTPMLLVLAAVAGWPLGPTAPHSAAVMTNLLGDDAHRWAELAAAPGARLHLYGKREARPGRKMGHVNRLQPLS